MIRIISNEADVKKLIKKTLSDLHILYFMPAMNGYGKAGVSDFICNDNGRFIAIEAKYDTKLTSAQFDFGMEVFQTGGLFLVINPNNIGILKQRLLDYRKFPHKRENPRLVYSTSVKGGVIL